MNKQILLKFYSIVMVAIITTQENDLRCSQYKKLIFEEMKTFSYFLPDANETLFTEDHCLNSKAFVVGGDNADPKEFPFAARLGHMAGNGYINWFCGGTILSETCVLTAAHCFYAPLGVVNRVRLGELDFNSDYDDAMPEDFMVKQLVAHPGYVHTQSYNDIGLVVLSSGVKFDRYKHPACLPIFANERSSIPLIAIGWGHKQFSGKSSSHLQKVTLRTYSNTDCQWLAEGPDGQERLPEGLKLSQLCAGSAEEKDTCQGDSGGPLLTHHVKYPCKISRCWWVCDTKCTGTIYQSVRGKS